MNPLRGLVFAGAATLAFVSAPREAAACGGCFHPQAEVGSSVVTDHRMVFKIGTSETVLWDQVRYTGDPKEFAWVLPVRDGAKVELSRDAWIAALDASTKTTVSGPERFCNGGGGGGGSGGGGCGGSDTSLLSRSRDNDNFEGASSGGFNGDGNVQVLAQNVIGPYQAVTIRANGDQGIAEWLIANKFAIPSEVRPTIDAYTRERFDFIALRLRPGQGVQAMRPVRVVTPGADATLPLRMVAAGVGAKVGLTLWVIGEGRYRTQNFPEGVIDYEKLVWDAAGSRSNLSDLQRDALASNDGRAWIVEAAERAGVTSSSVPRTGTNGAFPNPTLYIAYNTQCATRPPQTVKCTEDDLPPASASPDGEDDDPTPTTDAGTDASADSGSGDASAGADAGTTPTTDAGGGGSKCTKVVSGCDGFDDLTVALRGLHSGDVWVTRLRADLPVAALNADLRLEAASEQRELSAQHHTEKFSDPNFDPCAATRSSSSPSSSSDGSGGCVCQSSRPMKNTLGTFVVIGATAFAASRIVRRRKSR
jgi:hypothetical protein